MKLTIGTKKLLMSFEQMAARLVVRLKAGRCFCYTQRERRVEQERINPVAYVRDGDRFVVIASKGGAPTNPDWYYNVVANPELTVEVGNEKHKVHAKVAEEPERTQLYNKMVEMMPGFADYQQKTTRVIPVIVLTPVK